MKNRWYAAALLVAGIWPAGALGQEGKAPQPPGKEPAATKKDSGSFEVKLTPQPLADTEAGKLLGRMSIVKEFTGGLRATSRGEMLTALTGVEGSAGYVAIERVTGTLGGKKGSFVLQHHGLMKRGTQQLTITVVPDSGTEELKGLEGKMDIKIEEAKHFYVFEYSLPSQQASLP
jgi:hypothetical protein